MNADEDTYDVIVIGGGPTGENVADYARKGDRSVALIERELVGGECSYWACMPSKALLGPAHAAAAARRIPGASTGADSAVDTAAVFGWRDDFISDLDDSAQVEWLESTGTTLIRGEGRLSGERTVEVTGTDGEIRRLTAEVAVVIATGTSAAAPPIDGLDEIDWWDNRDVTTASEVPDRLAVIGAGAVGCEMAQAYARLGSDVTLIELADRILPSVEDGWVSELIVDAFEDDGIDVRLGVEPKTVRTTDAGPIEIAMADGSTVTTDRLLVATGRSPNTADLGLDTVGLEPGEYLEVDDRYRVKGVDGGWLYAVGDVNGETLLTHQGKYQSRLVGDELAGRTPSEPDRPVVVPQVIFLDPEVGAVGESPSAADERDGWRSVTVEMGAVAGAALTGQTTGKASLAIDPSDRVAGAVFVGPGAGELLHAATVAIMGCVTMATLWHAVPSFPTVSEIWLRLVEADREATS